jgi:hypothetical protein
MGRRWDGKHSFGKPPKPWVKRHHRWKVMDEVEPLLPSIIGSIKFQSEIGSIKFQ